ncbi:MAG: amidohydrolase [Leucobacter sp.]
MIKLYRNGRIYTADPDRPFVEALVVEGETILYAGDLAPAGEIAGEDAEVFDLAGRMLMPGLHDAHTHLLASGLKFTHELRLTPFAEPNQAVRELLAAHAPTTGEDACCDWIVGGEVCSASDAPDRLTRQQLDEAYPENPVFLYDYSIHHGVVNTRALEAAGIGESDESGHGGLYRRDEHGNLTGELIEEATWRVLRKIPDAESDVYRRAVAWAVGMCHRFGITSVQEASASPQALRAFRELEEDGALQLHIAAHLVWRNEGFGMATRAELDELLADHERWASRHVDTGFVKVWIDGAPLPPVPTHAALQPDDTVDETWLLVQEDELCEMVKKFDRDGRTVKIHCAGDGAVRIALNAVARVREENGPGQPHEIAHAGFVSEADYPRLAPLNVTAEMSPALWHVPEFGLSHAFWFSRMRDEGVRMTIGSDWIITPDPNLFPGIQGAVEHVSHPIPLEVALDTVTRAGAAATGKSDVRGTLTAGKNADYIILDRDLFGVATDQIGGAVVLQTFVEGECVHSTGSISRSL